MRSCRLEVIGTVTHTSTIGGNSGLTLEGDCNASLFQGETMLGNLSYKLTVTDEAQADGTFGVATVGPPSGAAHTVDFGAISIGTALTLSIGDGVIDCCFVALDPATHGATLTLQGPLKPHDE